MSEQTKMFFEDIEMVTVVGKDKEYIEKKYNDIIAKLTEIDAFINGIAEGWKTNRMGKVDLTLIRLAVFEMKYDEEVPVSVAINEAIELAKKFGGDESPTFINGILAKLA
jgi:N utilization substance protein B